MSIKTKTSTGATHIKAADDATRTVTIAFAQLNVVDHDRDITQPGAFQVGQKVKMCQTGHAHSLLPAGAGEIVGEQTIGDGLWAVAELKFFDTDAGEQTYRTVKALADAGHTQEWSYGYDILDSEYATVDGVQVQTLKSLSVYEVSPVLRGAGIGTHTLAVKAQAGECEACGQALPKSLAAEELDTTDTVDEEAVAAEADAKKRNHDAFVAYEVIRAKQLGAPITE